MRGRGAFLLCFPLLAACATVPEREADRELQKLRAHAETHPEDTEANLLYGEKLAQRGYGTGAIRVWQAAYRRDKNLIFLRRIADEYFRQGLEREAISAYEGCMSRFVSDPEFLFNMGWCHLRIGEDENALMRLSKFAALRSNEARGWIGMAVAQLNIAKKDATKSYFLDEARTNLERALSLEPENLTARFNLAIAHERKGEDEIAEKYFRSILERDPKHLETLENFALFYLRSERPAAAKPLLELAQVQEKDRRKKREIQDRLAELRTVEEIE